MRVTAALAACLVAFASAAHAQGSGVMLPVPPLPPIGLPLPHIGLPSPEADTRSVERQRRENDSPHVPRSRGRVRMPALVVLPPVIVAPESSRLGSAATEAPAPAPGARIVEPGTLDIEMEGNSSFQVFVDGYFAGSGQQSVRSLALEPGSHDVELRADGHATKTFRVRISPGQTLTYRDVFARTETQAGRVNEVPSQAAPHAGPVYVIPGCYAGNVRPTEATLPRGCDPSRTVVLDR